METQPIEGCPSAQTTLVLLLGASLWPDDPENFQADEAFARAVQNVQDYFSTIYGVSQHHVRSYFNDPRPASEMTDDIASWLTSMNKEARDLIVYYTGHGKLTRRHRELYLAIPNTKKRDPENTSLRIESLVQAITHVRLRRYYIFDCCFAEAASEHLQGANVTDTLDRTLGDPLLQPKGWTALFSSGKGEESIILPDHSNTFFSEALLQALQNSLAQYDKPVSFLELYPIINQHLKILYQRYLHHSDPSIKKYTKHPPRVQLSSGDMADIPIFLKQSKYTSQTTFPKPLQLELKATQQINQLSGHDSGVTALALSPNDEILVSGDKSGRVRIWDMTTNNSFLLKASVERWYESLDAVTSLIFHPEGRTFFVGWYGGYIKICKCQTGECIKSITFGYKNGVKSLAVSPDGIIFISSGDSVVGSSTFLSVTLPKSSIRKWVYPKTDKPIDMEDYSYIKEFDHYGSTISTPSIAYSSTGQFFAASSCEEIQIWDIFEGKERIPLKNKAGSWDYFTDISFHPKENLLAAINKEGQCLIWHVLTASIQLTLDPLLGKMTAIAFSPDGSYLAAAHSSGIIGFWDPISGEILHSFQAHDQCITVLVYSHSGYSLISGGLDQTIKVWGK